MTIDTSAAADQIAVDAAHIERETRRFVDVASNSPLEAHVPTYPAFTVETLARHVGSGFRIFQQLLSGGTYRDGDRVESPAGAEVIQWVSAGLDPLLEVLGEVSPDQPVDVPHGVGQQPAAALVGGLPVEVGIHRWDIESVLGDHVALPADLATVAIDKVFTNYVPRLASQGVAPIGGAVTLRATDNEVGWTARVESGRLVAGRLDPDVPADVTVIATTQDLALLVWKRQAPPHAGLNVEGNLDVLKRFLAVDYVPDPRTTPAH